MDYFLDTNVKIGYVFCTDPWNKESVQIFDNNDLLHYSYCVEKEFDRKYESILKEQKNFLFTLKDELNEYPNQFLSLKDLKIKSLIIPLRKDFDANKKEKIVEVLWKLSQSKHKYDNSLNTDVCNVNDLLKYLSVFIRSLDRKLIMRRNDFEAKVIFHPKRNEQYMNLNEKLLYEFDVHYPDNCIVLDAHNLALKECICLEFITSDEKMVNKVTEIGDILFVSKFHYLKDFVNILSENY